MIALYGHYRPNRPYSMAAYESLLADMLPAQGFPMTRTGPPVFFGALRRRPGKLLSYIDRFALGALTRVTADAVIVTDQSHAHVIPSLRARRRIAVCHDMIPWLYGAEELPGWAPSRAGRRLLDMCARGLRAADHVICVSERTRADLLRFAGVLPHKASVILQPARPARPAPSADDLRALERRLGATHDTRLVMAFCGGVYKNAETSIDAFAASAAAGRGAMLVLVGPERADLKARAAERGVRAARFLTDADDAVVAALYHRSACVLFPSHYEGFGWPVLDAQAAGAPVLASHAGSLPEVVGDSAPVHAPLDVAGFADLLTRTLEDDAFANDLRARGRANLGRFTHERWTGEMLDLLARLDIRAPA